MAKVTILKAGGKLPPTKAADGSTLKPIGKGTSLFQGPSHGEGGIPFKYGGSKVEVEGGETLQEGMDGADVMGGMKVPGTKKTFANVSKLLAKKEQKVKDRMFEGAKLIDAADVTDKWELLKFNTGEAFIRGGIKKLNEIEQNKEHLTAIQRAMLEHSEELGVDPNEFSKGKYVANKGTYLGKAKYGATLPKAQYGRFMFPPTKAKAPTPPIENENLQIIDTNPAGQKMSLAQRHNNPGNIMWPSKKNNVSWVESLGGVKGEYNKTLKNWYVKFPDMESGKRGMQELLFDRNYKTKTVEQASKDWTGGHAYPNMPAHLKGKRMQDLSAEEKKLVLDAFTLGEDSKKYNWEGVDNPIAVKRTTSPQIPFKTDRVEVPKFETPAVQQKSNKVVGSDYSPTFTNPRPINMPSNAKNLELTQVLPELYTAATNREEPVWMQQYQPELFEPYQVSFQDRLNEQNAQFNGIKRIVGDNPAALATLAGQQYSANSSVLGEEFRTNQAIANDVTNKNIALLNDAQSTNLKLADNQYVRQSTARSNTKAQNFNVLDSISNKLLQREADNQALKVYENLYPYYRFDPTSGKAIYGGPDADEMKELQATLSIPQVGFSKKKYGGSVTRHFNTYKKAGRNTMDIVPL